MAVSADALDQRIDARTAGDLALDAIDQLRTRQPEWIPRNASPEVVYLEALASVVAEVVSTADIVLGKVVESALTNLYGVPRLVGASATGNLTLTFDTATSTTIPTGTSFLLRDWGIELVSTADVVVAASTSATVPVATAEPTGDANGLGPADLVDVLDFIPNALAVAISGTLSGGAAPESDAEYLARARARLARVTSSLVVADHFTAYAAEDGRASNATTIAAWDGVTIGTAGTDAGDVTVCVYGHGGPMSTEDRASLAAAMQTLTAAGITVHVINAEVVTVDVDVVVHPLAGWVWSDVQASVTAALSAHLSAESWEWGEPVRVTTLISVCAGAEGVDYVTTLSAPSSDVAVTAAGVATAGALTVTVA